MKDEIVDPEVTPEVDPLEEPNVAKAFSARLNKETEKFKAETAKLQNELQQERESRIRSEERANVQTKAYTRTELLNLVDMGEMTQIQADQLLEDGLRKTITDDVLAIVDTHTVGNRVSNEIDKYIDLEPDIKIKGSEKWNKVAAEYNYLVTNGSPDSLPTQLSALRTVMGTIENMKKKSQIEVETHQETGGGSKPDKKSEKGALKSLTARQRDYYTDKIRIGLYKDWDDVEKEVNWKRG